MSDTQTIRELREQVKGLQANQMAQKKALENYLAANAERDKLRKQVQQLLKENLALKQALEKLVPKPTAPASKPREDESGV